MSKAENIYAFLMGRLEDRYSIKQVMQREDIFKRNEFANETIKALDEYLDDAPLSTDDHWRREWVGEFLGTEIMGARKSEVTAYIVAAFDIADLVLAEAKRREGR